jgi:hypothetical protein
MCAAQITGRLCLRWVKKRTTQLEHILSELLSIADIRTAATANAVTSSGWDAKCGRIIWLY